METQVSNQNETVVPLETKSCSTWYSPLCRASVFSRVAIALVVIALPFVGGYIGYQVALSNAGEVDWYPQALPNVLPPATDTTVLAGVNKLENATTTLALFFDRKPDWSGTVADTVSSGSSDACVIPENVEASLIVARCEGRYLSEIYEIVSYYGNCAGCELHYVRERLNPASQTQLKTFSNFFGTVFDTSTLTPYLIGVNLEKIFTLDLNSGVEQVVYVVTPSETLLVCEHACAAPANVLVTREAGQLYLHFPIYDANPLDDGPQGPISTMRRIELPML